MKNRFLKVCSFLLAISMMVIPVHAATPAGEMPIRAVGGSVTLYEGKSGTVTVAIETTEELECYGIEGVWDQGANGITLTKVEANDQMVFGEYDYIEAGKVQWNYEWPEEGADESPEDLVNCVEGTKLLIATYEVAAGTPAGDYKVSFTSNVFTGSDYEPIDEDITFEATITVSYHECTDTDRNHVCDDENCKKPMGTCEDADKDHACDYGCDKVYGEHVDNNKDHTCDYGCKEAIGTCEDADKDHACDYGCDKVYGEHVDNNKDHACDYGCKEAIGTCEDSDKDHACDYGCDKVYGTCEDKDLDHDCDYGCSKVYGEHKDSADDKDHVCDYCGKEIEGGETCSDVTTDADHSCDVCGETVGDHIHSAYDSDETHHWSVCDCGQVIADTKVEHDFDNGDCICGEKKPTTGLKGDLDLDGDVDSNDLTLLARHVGGIELLTGQALENADVDGDGEISANDLTVHARYVGGIIKEWP